MAKRSSELNRRHQAEWRARMTAEERKEYDRLRYLKYKEKYNAQSSRWAKDNPHKAHASTHQTTVQTKYPEAFATTDIKTHALASWLKEKRGTECPYCGAPAYHIDHKNPLARGGSHTWDNIEIICETCNFAKNNTTKEEYLDWIKALVARHSA